MSKMGISTYQSYCGAQVFEAIGLNKNFIEKYFTGTVSNVDGIGIDQVAMEAVRIHQLAYGNDPVLRMHWMLEESMHLGLEVKSICGPLNP